MMYKVYLNIFLLAAIFALGVNPSFATTSPLNTNAATDTGNDYNVELTTDGAGVWIAVWHSHDPMGNSVELDADIFYSRSTDNGVTWSAPAILNSDAANDTLTEDDYYPEITTDGAGLWIAVWESISSLGSTIGSDSDILYSISEDDGVTWSATGTLNTNAGSDVEHDWEPQLTTDNVGNWIAVWEVEDTNGGSFTDIDIVYSSYNVNNGTWSAPTLLHSNGGSDTGDDTFPQLTTNGSGNWIATWDSFDTLSSTIGVDSDILYVRSTNNGNSWSAPSALNTNAATDSGFDVNPQITTDGAGTWLATWYSTENLGSVIGGDTDILISSSTDNGASWSAPAALNPNAATDIDDDYYPQIITDGTGTWVALWCSWEDINSSVGTDSDILYALSEDDGATWSGPFALNSNAETDSGEDYSPQLTTDGADNWLVVWHSDDNLGSTIGIDTDIFYEIWAPSVTDVWYNSDEVPNGNGTEASPFNVLGDAVDRLAEDGTLHVPNGTIDEIYTIDKPMTIDE